MSGAAIRIWTEDEDDDGDPSGFEHWGGTGELHKGEFSNTSLSSNGGEQGV